MTIYSLYIEDSLVGRFDSEEDALAFKEKHYKTSVYRIEQITYPLRRIKCLN